MALFQEWHLLNNINDNISLIAKLLDNKHNNYYYLLLDFTCIIVNIINIIIIIIKNDFNNVLFFVN